MTFYDENDLAQTRFFEELQKTNRIVEQLKTSEGGGGGPAEQIIETSGPTTLDLAGILDGKFLRRVGEEVIGDDVDQLNSDGTILDIGAIADGEHLRRVGSDVLGHDLMSLLSPVKIIAVEYEDFTGTQAGSLGARGSFNISGLQIVHGVSKDTNKVLLLGQRGVSADTHNYGHAAARFTVDGSVLGVGAASGSRTRVGMGGITSSGAANYVSGGGQFMMVLYEPGVTTSKTYRLQAVNVVNATRTVYVNRTRTDYSPADPRGYSAILLLELEV